MCAARPGCRNEVEDKTDQIESLTGVKKRRVMDPSKIQDPLKELEQEFATERDFIDMLDEFPLEPVAWVPPGAVDEYITKVVKAEEDKKSARVRRAKKEAYKASGGSITSAGTPLDGNSPQGSPVATKASPPAVTPSQLQLKGTYRF